MNALVGFGTRRRAPKCSADVEQLHARNGLEVVSSMTARHRPIIDQVLAPVGPAPDVDPNRMHKRPTFADITIDVVQRTGEMLREIKPGRLLVQSDATVAVTAAKQVDDAILAREVARRTAAYQMRLRDRRAARSHPQT